MYKTHVITKKTSVVHEVDVRLLAHKAVAYVTGTLRLLSVSYMEIIKQEHMVRTVLSVNVAKYVSLLLFIISLIACWT